ncbi:hypothetical protein [Parapedobacter tibetensis]|uniref:hypothetical protein n=1 Tax=Parapedobacter tibetensis TaxID=2972951 RepID=UPI00214D77EB|nr:hypothetical protein [Parapedobacter tibetensis]
MNTLLIFLLYLATLTSVKAEQPTKRYVWNKSGIPVYASSQMGKATDTLRYGFAIEDLEEISILEETILFSAPPQETAGTVACLPYSHLSKWYRIRYEGGAGYIKDTYLMAIPPPMDYGAYIPIYEYLAQLADILSEAHQGQTEESCEHDTYTFSNGAYYCFTDLGPCESCGESIAETYLPGLDAHQGFLFMMVVHNIPMDNNEPSEDPYHSGMVYFYPQADGSLKFLTDYNEYTITERDGGILIFDHMVM